MDSILDRSDSKSKRLWNSKDNRTVFDTIGGYPNRNEEEDRYGYDTEQ